MLDQNLLSSNLKKNKIYRTELGSAVLCGCDIWSLNLREEHRLRVFEYRVMRKIFGPNGDEVPVQWPRGLRRRSAAARLLRSWVRIPPRA